MTDRLDRWLQSGGLERVPVDADAVTRLLADARRNLRTAQHALGSGDFSGACALLHDAARKSLMAVLSAQGLRVTAAPGAHARTIDAVRHLHGHESGGEVLEEAHRLRRTRHQAEYLATVPDADEISDDLLIARRILALAEGLIRTILEFDAPQSGSGPASDLSP